MRSRSRWLPWVGFAYMLWPAGGCNETPVDQDLGSVPAAGIVSISVQDDGGPIFRSLLVDLDGESSVEADYWAGNTPRLRVRSEDNTATHQVYLPRLRPAHLYTYEARSVSSTGDTSAGLRGTFTTDSLPGELREIELSVVGQASFGLFLLEVRVPNRPYYPIIVDTDGYIVWYSLDETRRSHGFARLDDGRFAFNTADGLQVVSPGSQELVARLTETEAAGRAGLESFNIHHDVIATPDSTLLFLVGDTSLVGDTVWTGEAIWEWNPDTNELRKRWASKDFLNPATDRGPRSVPRDWLHGNSLSIGPRGNILMSLFWLHEVISIAADFETIEWRLGGAASSFNDTEMAMEAGQHTAAEVEPGRILLFDNGLDRSEGPYSRAIEIELVGRDGSTNIVWEFRPRPDIYAPIMSSARRLDNGNTVVCFGLAEGLSILGLPPTTGPLAVFEVTPENRVLWGLGAVAGIVSTYRADPLPSIAGERVVGESEPSP